MSSDNGIPVMNKPVDMMEVGPNGNNLAVSALRRHPIEELQDRQGEFGRRSFILLVAFTQQLKFSCCAYSTQFYLQHEQ
jgi:hypothetical protein